MFSFQSSRALFVIVAILVTCSVAQAQNGSDVLVVARTADATGLDPHTQTAFASLRLLELIYEPLVNLDANLNIIPALAESWDFSDDATQLTFHLRQGVEFHDSTNFTAEDVVASYERILNEETGAAARANFLSIESIDTPDEYSVVFNLSEPDVPLLTAMTDINAAIISSENTDPSTETVGTGPFILENWTPDVATTLSANANWWDEGPFVEGIEIRIIPDETAILAALRAGTIDFALLNDPLVATLLIDDPNIVLNRVASSDSYHVLQLNAERAPMDQLEVRQAISCAIDRQEVLDTAALSEGQVIGPYIIPTYALPVSELFCYEKDLDRARDLLAQAGLEDGFSLNLMAANEEPPTALAEAQNIQAQLAEIGIQVEIESLELGVYVDRWLAADFDMTVALNSGPPDPYTMYARYWTSTGNLNYVAGYRDETLDRLMAEGRAETDPAERFEIFAEFQRHLVEQAPWVWLYVGYEYTAHQPYVTGFTPMPNDSLYYLSKVRLER
jgi:peptide/nickel transport system substrate-binding protein